MEKSAREQSRELEPMGCSSSVLDGGGADWTVIPLRSGRPFWLRGPHERREPSCRRTYRWMRRRLGRRNRKAPATERAMGPTFLGPEPSATH